MQRGARVRRCGEACTIVGIGLRTYRRWQSGGEDGRPLAERAAPSHTLSEAARTLLSRYATSPVLRVCRCRRSCFGWPTRGVTWRRNRVSIGCCTQPGCNTTGVAHGKDNDANRRPMRRRGRIRSGAGTRSSVCPHVYGRAVFRPVPGAGSVQPQDRRLRGLRPGVWRAGFGVDQASRVGRGHRAQPSSAGTACRQWRPDEVGDIARDAAPTGEALAQSPTGIERQRVRGERVSYLRKYDRSIRSTGSRRSMWHASGCGASCSGTTPSTATAG